MAKKNKFIWGKTWDLFPQALLGAILKFTPRHQIASPVMFTVYITAILTSVLFIQAEFGQGEAAATYIAAVAGWLWLTLLIANFAESLAESRGKAQAASLRKTRRTIQAQKINNVLETNKYTLVPAHELRVNDLVVVSKGKLIPSDGEVLAGCAFVNESAITGESAPVIRESGGDRSAVTGGTLVVSDWIVVRITANPGETFVDHMIALVEGARRQKTPNELALTILLAGLTAIFLVVCATLLPFSIYSALVAGGKVVTVTTLVALFVCLAPTTIGGLLSAIGIAGMDRMIRANVIAASGRAVEAAGDVDVLLLDKTGTITLGERQAVEFIPASGVGMEEFVELAQLSSLADETPEGRSIVILAKKYGVRERNILALKASFIPFTAQTRMSGINFQGRQIRKGSLDAIQKYLEQFSGAIPEPIASKVDSLSRQGATALIVVEGAKVWGIIHLKDIVKGGLKERFAELRQMGIKTIMVTGDNQLTAAAIAAEAGVDDFLAQATPEDKLKLISKLQAAGHLVAMTGDGTNDAPALAQADVAVAMNTGTQAAKEASNLIDLDSNPTKLVAVVEIGKQLLMTRGAITTFSIANDIAKYFAILPAAFAKTYPQLNALNIMQLRDPESAILSALIYNALIILLLVPLALRGVRYKKQAAVQLLRRNVFIYGLGGLGASFLGIKLINWLFFI